MQMATKHNQHTTPNAPSRDGVGQMFDRIAPRYDLLNRLLSLRRDVAWRKRLSRYLPNQDNLHILDLASGTADVLLSLLRHSSRASRGTGIDLSVEMLRLGQYKIERAGADTALDLAAADAASLPFADESFDVATIAFGIRNFARFDDSLGEIRRVLGPGGRLLILEFSLPHNRLMRWAYLLYFRNILPRLGAVISGDSSAYTYLNKTVETFPYGKQFCDLLCSAGFQNVCHYPLTFGIATIYSADKRQPEAGR